MNTFEVSVVPEMNARKKIVQAMPQALSSDDPYITDSKQNLESKLKLHKLSGSHKIHPFQPQECKTHRKGRQQ